MEQQLHTNDAVAHGMPKSAHRGSIEPDIRPAAAQPKVTPHD